MAFNVMLASINNWDILMQTPLVLKRGGCRVTVFCPPGGWLTANRSHDRWVPAGAEPAAFMAGLRAEVAAGGYDWVVLGDDETVKIANEAIDDDDFFRQVMPMRNVAERRVLTSKTGLARFCAARGIPAPRFAVHPAGADPGVSRPRWEALRFPVITKLDVSWAGIAAALSRTPEELADNIRRAPATGDLIVQEFIEGEERPVDALYHRGRLQVAAAARVLRNTALFGASRRRLYGAADPAQDAVLLRLGEGLALNGFANVTFLREAATGDYYLIEADLRPNMWLPYTRYGGRSFEAGVRRIAEGRWDGPPDATPAREVELALFYRDVRTLAKARRWGELARWLYDPRYWRYIPRDPVLLGHLLGDFSGRFRWRLRQLFSLKKR